MKSKKPEIKKDLEDEGTRINELKIERNRGNLTPEVVAMCEKQIDEMVEIAKNYAAKRYEKAKKEAEKAGQKIPDGPNLKDTAPAVEALKACPEDLALVCMFADDYDDVLKWNALHRKGLLPREVTVAHREVDIAMFNKICDKYQSTHTAVICWILYNSAYSKKK